MEPRLLRYIWGHTRPSQIWLSIVILLSMPFYFLLLDIPKRIINGPIQGKGAESQGNTFLEITLPFGRSLTGGDVVLFHGFQFGRIGLLVALSSVFLLLVVLNGWFKLYINTYKGRIGERLLRRLRYEMIDRVLRFPAWHTRRIRPPEIAGIIKDEVDPLSDFIGDSYSAPLFLAGQALTGLAFLFLQNFWFGLLTLIIVSLQAVMVPRLRRKLIHLGRERQSTAREMASRIGEIVQGTNDIHLNDVSNYARADFTARLGTIFGIRLDLYHRKFSVKFLNNLLMQFISVLFYLIGGYFVIAGRLDIGSLVASISAYKDLPTPIKGLIDWDQQRLLAQVRYAQALEAFHIDRLPPASIQDDDRPDRIRTGFDLRNVTFKEEGRPTLVDDVSLAVGARERVAFVSVPPEGGARLLEIMARLVPQAAGTVRLDGVAVDSLPESVTGRALGYVDGETFLPSGTIRDSLLSVLRNRPVEPLPAGRERGPGYEGLAAERLAIDLEWTDLARIGVADKAVLDARMRQVARQTGLYEDICEIGLNSRIADDASAETKASMVADRAALRDRLGEADLLGHVELFDPDRYLMQASIGENIVFGMPVDASFAATPLADNPIFLDMLEKSGLREPLDALGLQIASRFDEMLASISAESPLFDAIGAMTPERMAQLREILDRAADGTGSLDTGDRRELLKLALDYTEARDRFGLLDSVLRARILEARRSFRIVIDAMAVPPVMPHDPAVFDPSLGILDNVLFGLIATRNVNARARVIDAVRDVLKAGGHWDAVFDAGLLFQIGSGGRGLSEGQRQKLHLARALIKKPDMFILNRACSVLPRSEQQALLQSVISGFAEDGDAGPGIVCLPSDPDHAVLFDRVVVIEDGHVVADGPPDVVLPARRSPALVANI